MKWKPVMVGVASLALLSPVPPAVADNHPTILTSKPAKATKVRGFDTASATIGLGKPWSATATVTGKSVRTVKLQVRSKGGAWKTVKKFKTNSKGRVKVNYTFTQEGDFEARLFVTKAKGRKSAVSGVKQIGVRQVFPTAFAGSFSGETGGTSYYDTTSWSGTVKFYYQERDPIINTPWPPYSVHYTPIEASVQWQYSPPTGCTATPSSGVLTQDSLDGRVEVERTPEPAKGGYRYSVGLAVPYGKGPQVDVACPDPDTGEINHSTVTVDFGDGGLLTNGLGEGVVPPSAHYTDLKVLTGDINRIAQNPFKRWTWNLPGTGELLPPLADSEEF